MGPGLTISLNSSAVTNDYAQVFGVALQQNFEGPLESNEEYKDDEECENDEEYQDDEYSQDHQDYQDNEELILLQDSEDAPKNVAVSKTPIYQPWLDDKGLVRVGPQPREEIPFVLSGPLGLVMRQISNRVWGILRRVDAKFPNVDQEEVKSRHSRLITHLHSLLVSHGEDRARIVCDYTGMNMSWALGSRSPSIEAFYPFVVQNGQVRYHVPKNVGLFFTP
jgi:hypothetical protein